MRTALLALCAWPCIAGGFGYNLQITTIPAKVSGSSVKYPLLVRGTFPTLRTVANGGHVRNANGFDIAFGTDAACAVALPFLREYWNPSTGDLVAFVTLSSISSSAASALFLCYGNASVSSDPQTPAAVWDGAFQGRWGFPDGSTLSAKDSTSNGLDGTISNATATAGVIDGGALLNGSNAWMDMGVSSALDPVSAFTVEAWFNPAASWTLPDGAVVGKIDNAAQNGYMIWYTASGNLYIFFNGSATYVGTFASGSWYHLALTWDGATYTMYVNGSPARTLGSAVAPHSAGQHFRIGEYSGSRLAAGVVDEVRYSNICRSAGWIMTEYANYSSPSSFYTVSAENIAPSTTAAGFGYTL
ncbi:MAG TPA: LamG domain-containing protein [Bryobacteraceae bacterium]|nr:LamG domain-containing protein [Bryobacteraceae bacterium]